MNDSTRARSRRGEPADALQYTASEAKHKFGQLLDTALRDGPVTITKQRKPVAVIISLDEYRALAHAHDDMLAELSAEFDRRYEAMQAPAAADAMQRAFDTPAAQLAAFAAASPATKPARKKPVAKPARVKRG